jgi:hypothetical protein
LGGPPIAAIRVTLGDPPAKTIHPLDGFGAQLNTNLFTKAGQPEPHLLTASRLGNLRATVGDVRLGHSRIFVVTGLRPDTADGRETPEFRALMETIKLAQHAGANVNLTWWGQGPYASKRKLENLRWPNRDAPPSKFPSKTLQKWPKELTDEHHPHALTGPRLQMLRFAQLVEHIRKKGFDCVTHLTVQNEPNGSGTDLAQQHNPGLSMRLYELLYRDLDKFLRRPNSDPLRPGRSLRKSVKLIGGDLVERGNSHQDEWLAYMHANMAVPRPGVRSVLDGYSVHVYWDPRPRPRGFPAYPEKRLRELQETIQRLGITKRVYVTEYGVRRLDVKQRFRPGKLDGHPIERLPLTGLQHAWFNALATQHGCVGLSKWILYRTDKPKPFGRWGMLGSPSESFEETPTYRVTRLFNHLVPRGWKAHGLGRGGAGTIMASRFVGPRSAESIVVLNRGRRAQQVRVEGLTAGRRYFAADWNRDRHGHVDVHSPARVRSDTHGAATVTVPGHGIVALSSRRLPP